MSIDKNIGENAESQNRDAKAEKRLLDVAVREYVERRFKTDGKAFFEEFSGGVAQNDKFKDFLRKREGYKTLAERKKYSNELFSGDVRRVAFHLDELKKTVRNAISLEFDLKDETNAKNVIPAREFERLIERLNLSELENLTKSSQERADFVWIVTKEKSQKYRKGWTGYLSALQEKLELGDYERELLENHLKNVRNFDDVENAKNAFKSGNVSEDEIRTVLGFIRTPEAKRAIVKAFLPQISIAELVRMKIFTRDQAENALYENLCKNGASADSLSGAIIKEIETSEQGTSEEKSRKVEAKLREIAEDFDFRLAYVSTMGLSEDGLDKLLDRSELPKILERKVAEGMEELKNILDAEKDLKPDANGSLAVSFAKKIAEEFTGNEKAERNIPGVELLVASASGNTASEIVFEGVVKADGSAEAAQKIRMRIKGWTEHGNTGERKMNVAFLDDNNQEARSDDLSYDEFYRLAHRLEERSFQDSETIGKKILVEAADFKRQVETAKAIENEGERNRKLEEIIGPDIRSAEQLEEMFKELDSAGASLGIKKGVSVILGKAWENGFNVVTIDEVIPPANGREGEIVLLNTNPEGTRRQTVTFWRFYAVARFLWASRSAGINSAAGVLGALGNSLMKAHFEDVSVDGDDLKFVPKSKRGQPKYEGVKVFYKKDGKAFQIGAMEAGKIQIRMLDSFDPGEQAKGKNPKGTSSSNFAWYGYETLYMLIRQLSTVPYEGLVEEKEIKEPEYTSNGRMKKFLNNPSFYDVIHGMQEIPKFIKKKLEHSSHHHAAHMTLAIAGKIPLFPEDWLTDLQMEIHNEDKSTLGKEVDRLNSFSSPKRQEQALRYLKNKGSHDYEIIAAALSLLEKHGNLYPGALAKYEKDWIFFSRMPGSMEAKHAFLKEKRFGPDGKEREVKEPEIIMLWLQRLSGPQEHHPISPYYWLEVKKRWRAGTTWEFEMGGKEADGKETLLERTDYAVSKFKSKEYAHGIGAMEKIWDKPNGLGATVSGRMRVPFVLAMSNVRNNIHPDLAQKFTPMFDSGHVYPPLLFIQYADKQDVFRKVIKRLASEGGTEMSAAYSAIDKLIHESSISLVKDKNDELLIDALDKFWGKYGDKLSKKLLATVEDPELILRKDEVPEFAEYLSIVGGEYGNTKFDGGEIDCGTYEVEGANWALMAPSTFVKQFKVQAGHGGLNSELEQYLFGTFKKSLEKIRNTKYGADETENLKVKRQLFREFHLNFQQYIHTRLGSDKLAEDPKKKGTPKFANEPYMLQLTSEFGFTAKIPEEAVFEGTKYDDWMKDDFDRFMAIKSVKQYGNAVSTNVDTIIERNVFPAVPRPESPLSESESQESENRELAQNIVIVENFRYKDAEGLAQERLREMIEKPFETNERKYADALLKLYDEYGKEVVDDAASALVTECLSALRTLGVSPTPYAKSKSWALWDLAKQKHFSENPDEATPWYLISDPLESQEKMDEIFFRHIGWEAYVAYRMSDDAEKTRILWRVSAASLEYVRGIMETGGHVTSKQFAEIGASFYDTNG